jgi:hypothetical protein
MRLPGGSGWARSPNRWVRRASIVSYKLARRRVQDAVYAMAAAIRVRRPRAAAGWRVDNRLCGSRRSWHRRHPATLLTVTLPAGQGARCCEHEREE